MAKLMAKKDTAKTKKGILSNWIVRNLVLAVLMVIGLLLAAQLGLGLITRHNRTVAVPDFTNMTVAEAIAPHSMDTPVMMLSGYTVLAGICCWGWF